jgi:hypothetical protein
LNASRKLFSKSEVTGSDIGDLLMRCLVGVCTISSVAHTADLYERLAAGDCSGVPLAVNGSLPH